MMQDQTAIKFNCIQVSNLLTVLEKHGVDLNMDDSKASEMFSELVVVTARELDSDQSDQLFRAI